MAEKNINSRIQNKHDTEENWDKATNFIPKIGEFIIYDKDSTHTYQRLKVGDGVTTVPKLEFISVPESQLDSFTESAGIVISESKPSFKCTWFKPKT